MVALGAGPAAPEIDRAQRLIEAAEFEEAVRVLDRTLDQADLSDRSLVEIYRLLGLAHLNLGDEGAARDAYEKLLQAQPDFELSKKEPPKIRALYARIKEDVKKRRLKPVSLTFDPPAAVEGGRPVELGATIQNLGLGSKARLYFRRSGSQVFSSVDFTRERGRPNAFLVTLPAFELAPEKKPYEIEYYVEVSDMSDRRLAGKGDAFAPAHFSVVSRGATSADTESASRWYQNPWVWVGGAGALAAIGVVTLVVLSSSHDSGSLPVTIRVSQTP